ncbi:MAG: arylesterase [Verrucomicrobiota bacterium]
MARLYPIRAGAWTLLLAVLFMLLAGNIPATEKNGTPKNVLILGDSLAAGYGINREEAFPALLQKKIEAAKLPYLIVNGGVSGDTTAGGLRRIDWMLKQPVDVLIVELGGNDGLRGIPPAETKKNLQGIIDKAKQKYPQVRVVIAGMQMPPNMGEDYTKAFAEVFPTVAKANQATLIPFLLEGVGGQADLNQQDGIHPTPKGHEVVAENVWKVLATVLK